MSEQYSIDDRLWDYIDGSCTQEEKGFVEALIAAQQEWRDKYHALLEVHQLMQQSLELDEPSLRFSQNVMEEIGRHQIAPATKTYIDKKVINGIGLFFLVMLVGFFIYGIGQISWSGAGVSGSFISGWLPARVDWSLFFNNTYLNIFMMVNVVLGLVLLDMYLGKKKRELRAKGGVGK